MEIKLSQFIGERCITAEDGKKLLSEIKPKLLAGEIVVIDFTGVKILLSLFLNNSIAPLYENFDQNQLNHVLFLKNTSGSQENTLTQVKISAEKYYRNPNQKKAVDESMDRFFVEKE